MTSDDSRDPIYEQPPVPMPDGGQQPSPERDLTGTGLTDPAAPAAIPGPAEVKGSAAAAADEVKDLAMERGSEVAEVAKDELLRLAEEARGQARSLWSEASEQLRDQANSGKQHLAGLLHSLAGELGQMASRSEQAGPLTAFSKGAAARLGEMSHWLQETDPGDVLTEIRRFARRRPVAFLAGAALAGLVVGRLSRGLMADAGPSSNRGEATTSGRRAAQPVPSAPPRPGSVPAFPAEDLRDEDRHGSELPGAQPGAGWTPESGVTTTEDRR